MAKKVYFDDNIEICEKENDQNNSKDVQEKWKVKLKESSTGPGFIKQSHRPNLTKLSLNELEELLKKQEKIIHNKQLLSTLKDNGEKVLRFYDEIKEQIRIVKEKMQIDDDIEKTEKLFDQLTIKEKPLVIDKYSENRARLMDHPTNNLRFNQCLKPQKEKEIKNELKDGQTEIPSEKTREMKILNYEESLKRLAINEWNEKIKSCERLSRFYTYNTRDDDLDLSSDVMNNDDDDDFTDSESDSDYSDCVNIVNYSH